MSLTKEIKFWGDDISVLFENVFEFFPTKSQTDTQKLNSITRLAMYIVALLSIQTQSLTYIKYFLYVLVATFVTHYLLKNKKISSNEIPQITQVDKEAATKLNRVPNPHNLETLENTNDKCESPTLDNPFMNVNYVDYLDNPNREEACDINNPDIKKDMNQKYMNNLYRDVNDLFEKNNSQRQFYTMPSTTIPNKQDEFAKWLYLSPKTCKEDQDYCLRYEDLRQKRPVLPNQYENPVNTKRLEE